MKVELNSNGGASKQKSIIKQLRKKQRQYQNQIKRKRVSSQIEKPQINIEVIDPLSLQVKKYRQQQTFKKTHEISRASQNLKKYIIEQEKNLKFVRLDKINSNSISPPKRPKINFDTTSVTDRRQKIAKNAQQINIPKIEQTFKNQHQQYVLYQSKLMRNQINRAITLIDNGVAKLKNYSFKGLSNVPSTLHSRKESVLYPSSLDINPQNTISQQNSKQEYQLDKIIQKKLDMSQKLRNKMQNYKKRMSTIQNQMDEESPIKSISFITMIPKKPKKKVYLKGIKSVSYKKGQQQIKVTPASSLLFDLNKMSIEHQKRQQELSQLLHNSYHNRDTILSQKSIFYQQSNSFSDLSPSNQFRLRKQMDKKLIHTIQITKEQINKFISYLTQIKSYHVIISETILSILKEVRLFLLQGRVMKLSDLQSIISSKNKNELIGYPNQLIIQKLSEMMI